MPREFQQYFRKKVTVIIDCFELFIETPSKQRTKQRTRHADDGYKKNRLSEASGLGLPLCVRSLALRHQQSWSLLRVAAKLIYSCPVAAYL